MVDLSATAFFFPPSAVRSPRLCPPPPRSRGEHQVPSSMRESKKMELLSTELMVNLSATAFFSLLFTLLGTTRFVRFPGAEVPGAEVPGAEVPRFYPGHFHASAS